MSISDNRKIYIRERLKTNNSVLVGTLAKELQVSEMTIRRDLSELEKEGFLRRIHGGAVREVSRIYEPPFNVRKTICTEEKILISQKAVELVEEGETIAIDSGTTAIELAKQLTEFRNLTIATPSIHIALLFLSNPGIETILSGGKVRKTEGSLIGEITRNTFKNLFFDKFFLSTAGISIESGFTEYIMDDAAIKKLIMSHSKKTIALMDSSKFNQTAFSQVCALKDVDVIITDKEPGYDFKKVLTDNQVILETTKPKE